MKAFCVTALGLVLLGTGCSDPFETPPPPDYSKEGVSKRIDAIESGTMSDEAKQMAISAYKNRAEQAEVAELVGDDNAKSRR